MPNKAIFLDANGVLNMAIIKNGKPVKPLVVGHWGTTPGQNFIYVHWRQKISSLNYLLASHVWQQDHNGFTHQGPGFLDHVINKKADIVRVYLPPDANCLLSVFDHCLRSRNYVNVVVAAHLRLKFWPPFLFYVSICLISKFG
jgi:phosphoketolase